MTQYLRDCLIISIISGNKTCWIVLWNIGHDEVISSNLTKGNSTQVTVDFQNKVTSSSYDSVKEETRKCDLFIYRWYDINSSKGRVVMKK